MSPKVFIVMAVFWTLFLIFIVVTQGPWWLAALAAVFVAINVWRLSAARSE